MDTVLDLLKQALQGQLTASAIWYTGAVNQHGQQQSQYIHDNMALAAYSLFIHIDAEGIEQGMPCCSAHFCRTRLAFSGSIAACTTVHGTPSDLAKLIVLIVLAWMSSTSTISISSDAYAIEERLSEANTASPIFLLRVWCGISAVFDGGPKRMFDNERREGVLTLILHPMTIGPATHRSIVKLP